MRLSWKDAWATVLVVVGLAMALSVTQGWSSVSYTHLTLPTIYSV